MRRSLPLLTEWWGIHPDGPVPRNPTRRCLRPAHTNWTGVEGGGLFCRHTRPPGARKPAARPHNLTRQYSVPLKPHNLSGTPHVRYPPTGTCQRILGETVSRSSPRNKGALRRGAEVNERTPNWVRQPGMGRLKGRGLPREESCTGAYQRCSGH